MPSTPLTVRESIEPDALRPVVDEARALVAMLGVLGLSTLLAGLDRSVPGFAVTIRELVVATGTVAVVVWLAHSIPAVTAFVRSNLDGPPEVVADAGRIVGALVAFLAVLVAHRGLAAVLVPAFVAGDAVWAYDLASLAVGLVPLAVIGNRVGRNLVPVAELVTAAVAHGWGRRIENEPNEAT